MKTTYPAPEPKHTTLDMIHTLQSKLAHRTRGSTKFERMLRCSSKLLAMRMLERLERSFNH